MACLIVPTAFRGPGNHATRLSLTGFAGSHGVWGGWESRVEKLLTVACARRYTVRSLSGYVGLLEKKDVGMVKAWKVAEETMTGYFASKGEVWPAIEASEILRRVRIGPDHRWADRQLVAQAEGVLARARFPVSDLVKNHLKIVITYQSLKHLDKSEGCCVYGCAYPQTREIVICKRTLKYEPLCRTTVAHELGHVLMHKKAQQRCLLYTPQRAPSTPEEREANAFMQAIIMPDSVLDLGIRHVCHIWGIDTRLVFAAANGRRGRFIWQENLFASLINMLCISREMISIKMKECGYFSEETAEHHKSYALKTRWHTPLPRESLVRQLNKIMADLRQRVATANAEAYEPVVPNANDQQMTRSQTRTGNGLLFHLLIHDTGVLPS